MEKFSLLGSKVVDVMPVGGACLKLKEAYAYKMRT